MTTALTLHPQAYEWKKSRRASAELLIARVERAHSDRVRSASRRVGRRPSVSSCRLILFSKCFFQQRLNLTLGRHGIKNVSIPVKRAVDKHFWQSRPIGHFSQRFSLSRLG